MGDRLRKEGRLMKLNLLLWGNLVLVLGALNWIIQEKEDLLGNGRVLLLEVGKFDPRSLMQGDYMRLQYLITQTIQEQLGDKPARDGAVVLAVDEHCVGTFRRFHKKRETLAQDEQLLHYKVRSRGWNRVRVAAESFFFQEGMGEKFALARYAELRVDPRGNTLLVALRDRERKLIGGKGE
jgi:uncharacterized membrane-anchored protein